MSEWQELVGWSLLCAVAVLLNVLGARRVGRGEVFVRGVAFTLGYLAINQLSYATYFGPVGEGTGTMWLSSGYLIGCLLIVPRRWYLGMVLLALACRLTSGSLLQGQDWPTNVFWCLANITEGVLGSLGLRWLLGRQPDITRAGDLLRFTLISVLVATAASAAIGSTILRLVFGQEDLLLVWQTWWFSNALGVLGLGTCLLAWFEPRADVPAPPDLRGRWLEFFGLLTLVLLTSMISIGPYPLRTPHLLAFPYLVLPGLVWAGLRFSARLASTMALGVALLVVFTANGTLAFLPGVGPTNFGPFRVAELSTRSIVLAIQGFLLLMLFATPLLVAITRQRQRAERQAVSYLDQLYRAQQNEAVANLAGGVAHDINNLLSVMRTHRQQVADRVAGDPGADDLAASLRAMDQATAQATAISRSLLDLSRKHDDQPAGPFAIWPVVRDAAELYRALLPQRTTLLLLPPANPSIPVHGSATRLQQVVLNLLVNARDAIGDKPGRIELGVRLDNDQPDEVELFVRDTGCGMSEQLIPLIFEPLFTTKPDGKGTGLGLSIVRSAVADLGGRVEVESAVGRGSTFRVHLPIEGGRVTTAIHQSLLGTGVFVPPADRGLGATVQICLSDAQISAAAAAELRRQGWVVVPIEDTEPFIAAAVTDVVALGSHDPAAGPGALGSTIGGLPPTGLIADVDRVDLDRLAERAELRDRVLLLGSAEELARAQSLGLRTLAMPFHISALAQAWADG